MGISLIRRRESIIVSTIEILNEVGLQNLSTKLIANREGISEGTLFRHFKSKSDILSAVIDHYSQFDEVIINTCMNSANDPVDNVRYFFNRYAEYYENYPEITILQQLYDSLMYESELSGKVKNIINRRGNFVVYSLKRAQNEGLIGQEADCSLIAEFLLGGTKELCLKWRMTKFGFSIKDRTSAMVELFIDGFIDKK